MSKLTIRTWFVKRTVANIARGILVIWWIRDLSLRLIWNGRKIEVGSKVWSSTISLSEPSSPPHEGTKDKRDICELLTIFRNQAYHWNQAHLHSRPFFSSPLLSPKKSRVAEHKHIIVFRSRSRHPALLQLFGVMLLYLFSHYIIASEELKLNSTKKCRGIRDIFCQSSLRSQL